MPSIVGPAAGRWARPTVPPHRPAVPISGPCLALRHRRRKHGGMTSARWFPGSSGEDTPEETLAALRRTDPVGLAQHLGDLAFLLQGLAGDPAELFTTEGRARREFSDLLGAIQASRGALDSLEARA